jgi:hypothetical protein
MGSETPRPRSVLSQHESAETPPVAGSASRWTARLLALGLAASVLFLLGEFLVSLVV